MASPKVSIPGLVSLLMERSDGGMKASRVEADVRRRFLASILLTVPVFLLSPLVSDGGTIFAKILVVGMALIVAVYGGWPYLSGMWRELASNQPAAMTPLGIGLSAYTLYSFYTVWAEPAWKLADLVLLVDILLLGQWTVMKSLADTPLMLPGRALAWIVPALLALGMVCGFVWLLMTDKGMGVAVERFVSVLMIAGVQALSIAASLGSRRALYVALCYNTVACVIATGITGMLPGPTVSVVLMSLASLICIAAAKISGGRYE